MYIVLTIVHILVAFIMVGVILLQSGKGAEIGAAFGGSSQTVFGSRGAGTFLSKLTAVAATIWASCPGRSRTSASGFCADGAGLLSRGLLH